MQKDFSISTVDLTYTIEDGDAMPFRALKKFPAWEKYTIPYPPAPKKKLIAVVFDGDDVQERSHIGIEDTATAYGLNVMQVKNSLREHSLMLKAPTGEYVSFLSKTKHTALMTDATSRQEWTEKRRDATRNGGRKTRSDKGKNHNKARKEVDLMTFMIWMQLAEQLAEMDGQGSRDVA